MKDKELWINSLEIPAVFLEARYSDTFFKKPRCVAKVGNVGSNLACVKFWSYSPFFSPSFNVMSPHSLSVKWWNAENICWILCLCSWLLSRLLGSFSKTPSFLSFILFLSPSAWLFTPIPDVVKELAALPLTGLNLFSEVYFLMLLNEAGSLCKPDH